MTTKKQNQDYFFTLVSYLYISEYINYFKYVMDLQKKVYQKGFFEG